METGDIKILIVDDEADILEIITYSLENAGYKIYTAKNGIEAVDKASMIKPDLIVLDVMMPEMDGIEACEIIRNNPKTKNTLITFLSARGEDYSQIAGFNAGADDYITKPIKPKILLSKVKSLLRRITIEKDETIQLKDLIIDRSSYKVLYQGKKMNLPRKEFELLYLLASRPGKVFKREYILESVWGKDVVVGDRTIDVHIRKLREKIGNAFFETVKGVGYKLVV